MAVFPLVMFVLVEVTLVHVDALCVLYSNVAPSWSPSLSETAADIVVASVNARVTTHGYGDSGAAPRPRRSWRSPGRTGWPGLVVLDLQRRVVGELLVHGVIGVALLPQPEREILPVPPAALAIADITLNAAGTVMLLFSLPSQLPLSKPTVSLDWSATTPGLLFQVVALLIVPLHDKVTAADDTQSDEYASAVFTTAEDRWPAQIADGTATW